MKKLFLILCLTVITSKCYSQQNSDLYIIKLKSGLLLKAELIKIVPDSFAIIKQYGLETKINMSDIIEITFNQTNPTVQLSKKVKSAVYKKSLPDSGWSWGWQLGFLGGLANKWGWGSTPTTSFVSRIVVLKKIAPKTQIGGQIGFDPFALYSFVAVPIEAHIRQFAFNKPKTPFIYGNMGYGLNISRGNPIKTGGLTYGAGIGRSYRTQRQKVLSFMFGFKVQKVEYEFSTWNSIGWGSTRNSVIANLNIRRFEFRTELLF